MVPVELRLETALWQAFKETVYRRLDMSGCLILAAFSLQKSKFKKQKKELLKTSPKKKKTFKADWDSLISLWASRSQIEAPKAHKGL